jgi:squalene monooxygenase
MPVLQVHGYCMFKNGEEAKVRYPTEGFTGDVAGRSFHNGRFVQRLRQAAASQKLVTLRQGVVKSLLNGKNDIHPRLQFVNRGRD